MNVMKRAWEIARTAVEEFGGKVREYFRASLIQAWAEKKGTFVAVKKATKKVLDIPVSDIPVFITHTYKFVEDTLINKEFCGFGKKRKQAEVEEKVVKAGTEVYMYYQGEPILILKNQTANGTTVKFERVQELIKNGTLEYVGR